MEDDSKEPKRRRGTVLLFITIIIIGTFAGLYAIPRTYSNPDLSVRVAIVDSGVNINQELETRVVSARSFVNTSLGYSETDNSTSDSNPDGVTHGTYVASIIVSEDPDAALVIAKVVSSGDVATPSAIEQAIRWAVLEENCSVINLSLGIPPIYNDSIKEVIQWAFNRGVVVVAAAGNNGQAGITGSSVESPAIYPEVIAVAAVDDSNFPYSFSATGPLRNRVMKPDISATGYFKDGGKTVLGTSFAAPVVSAAAARIISHCITNGFSWTPGMIKAAIMIGAYNLPFEEWQVGAGLLDLETSLLYIDHVQQDHGLPLLAVITPTESPFSFEQFFVNHTSRIRISVFASEDVTFSVNYNGAAAKWLKGPSSIRVNQSGEFTVDIRVEANTSQENLEASISVTSSNYFQMKLELAFDALVPLADVAFDISHTSWAMDSSYGRFRQLFRTLTKAGIAVDELRFPENLSLDVLSLYDLVFVLDPCAWAYAVDGFVYEKIGLYSFTTEELDAYSDYFANGGHLFLVGLSNASIDLGQANSLFSQFNITLNDDQIPGTTIVVNGVPSTELITGMISHSITEGIDAFDYNGCSLNFTGTAYEIAWKNIMLQDENGTLYSENRTVLVGLENNSTGRLLATGSNIFLDNWALTEHYESGQDLRFVLQAISWLLGVPDT
jgi:hypothetical protein